MTPINPYQTPQATLGQRIRQTMVESVGLDRPIPFSGTVSAEDLRAAIVMPGFRPEIAQQPIRWIRQIALVAILCGLMLVGETWVGGMLAIYYIGTLVFVTWVKRRSRQTVIRQLTTANMPTVGNVHGQITATTFSYHTDQIESHRAMDSIAMVASDQHRVVLSFDPVRIFLCTVRWDQFDDPAMAREVIAEMQTQCGDGMRSPQNERLKETTERIDHFQPPDDAVHFRGPLLSGDVRGIDDYRVSLRPLRRWITGSTIVAIVGLGVAIGGVSLHPMLRVIAGGIGVSGGWIAIRGVQRLRRSLPTDDAAIVMHVVGWTDLNHLVIAAGGAESRYRWSAFESVRREGDLLQFQLSTLPTFLALPKRCFADTDAFESFRLPEHDRRSIV